MAGDHDPEFPGLFRSEEVTALNWNSKPSEVHPSLLLNYLFILFSAKNLIFIAL